MVARTPQKQRKVAMVVAPLNSDLLRETISKVDKCMERLQELQYTIAGGNKVVSGVNLSPRSTRSYLRTSLRCKQETLRIKNATHKKSPVGKFPAASSPGDWRKMSLPAMLLGETVNEILQASQVTKDIVDALAPKKSKKLRRSTSSEEEDDGPKTPEIRQKSREPIPETVRSNNIKARRKKEKQNKRSESDSPPSLQRARSRIVFRIVSPLKTAENVQVKGNGESSFRHSANRVSPKHKPWVKKAVLFPNPLFISGTSTQQAKFSRTMSPVIARTDITSSSKNSKETPHKFLIKSPPTSASKFQVKIKSPPKFSISPTRNSSNLARKSPRGSISPRRNPTLGKKSPTAAISPIRNMGKKSPKLSTAARLRRSFTPTRNLTRKSSIISPPKRVTLQALISPARNGKKSPKPSLSPTRNLVGKKTQKVSTAAKLKRSFSPSRLAMRLVSPMKSRKSVGKCDDNEMVSGLKQRPVMVPKRFSMGRI